MTLDELVTDVDGQPHLLGSRCMNCRAVTFPAHGSCPRCTGQRVEQHVLARRGTLWTWTTQAFRPKPPFIRADRPFTPYGVGYVDVDGEVLVEARLVTDDLESLRIGTPMELVLDPFHHDDEGQAVVTYAFAPCEEGP
jgi:uncharacterized protein